MQIENDYDKEVYNGDIGFVADVKPEEGELTASLDGRSVNYGFGELDTLVPAYAASIHKSQGSEYPAGGALLGPGKLTDQRKLLSPRVEGQTHTKCLLPRCALSSLQGPSD